MSKVVQIFAVQSLMPTQGTHTILFHLLDDGRVFSNSPHPDNWHNRIWHDVTYDAPWLDSPSMADFMASVDPNPEESPLKHYGSEDATGTP